ncbi:MAG: DUF1491 family protein [Beijerinckiaceae bacterium]
MTVRLKSELWASAWLRRCGVVGVPAVMRKRGAAEAGAIFLKIDRLDGTSTLYGPAFPNSDGDDEGDRVFRRLHDTEWLSNDKAEERLDREMRFDPDLWLLEAEDRTGAPHANIAASDNYPLR